MKINAKSSILFNKMKAKFFRPKSCPYNYNRNSNTNQIKISSSPLKIVIKYKINKTNKIKKIMQEDGFECLNKKSKQYENVTKNNYYHNKIPPVGTYNPEVLFTIFHEVQNKSKYGNSSLGLSSITKRNQICDFQKKENNGPGEYFRHNVDMNKLLLFRKNLPAFNTSGDRFKDTNKTKKEFVKIYTKDLNKHYLKEMNKTRSYENGFYREKEKNIQSKRGPGAYEYLNDRYPWVKPTFNIKYM